MEKVRSQQTNLDSAYRYKSNRFSLALIHHCVYSYVYYWMSGVSIISEADESKKAVAALEAERVRSDELRASLSTECDALRAELSRPKVRICPCGLTIRAPIWSCSLEL